MPTPKPASWSQAKLHAKAMTPGISSNYEQSETCTCCNAQINKEAIPMCENIKQLAILGPGFPLYFTFLKYSIIMIFLLSISYSVLTIYWAYTYNFDFCIKHVDKIGKNNEQIHCTGWMVLLSRLEIDVDGSQRILRITSFVTQLFFLAYIREQLRKHNAYFHERQEPKISDYSVFIKNIPQQSQIKQKIQDFFKINFEGRYKIEYIRPIAYLDGYSSNFDKIQQESKKYLSIVAKGKQSQKDQAELEIIKNCIATLEAEDRNREDQCAQSIQLDEVICQKVIVILSTEKEKQLILKEKVNLGIAKQIFGEGATNLKIAAAPEPNELILSNINLPKSSKIKRIILGWMLFAVLLAAVTAVFYFLLSFKAKEIQLSLKLYKQDPLTAKSLKLYSAVLALTSIVLIVLFNKLLLAPILHKITEIERHKTAASQELSFSIKYALGLVFTTAMLTLLVENIKFHNIYEHDYGVIEEETIMYFFSAFFVPLIWFVNPWHIWRRAKMFFFDGSQLMTQTEANQLMELPEYNIGKRYGEIIEMVWFTYFYASLIPIGALLALIGASLFYWVDKYNLLRKSSVKQIISEDFSMRALIMLDLTLILKPAGEIAFDMQIRQEWNYQSVALMVIGLVYVLLPKDTILDWINGEKFQLNRQSYKEIETSKLEIYTQLNPRRITPKEGFKYQPSEEKCEQLMQINQEIPSGQFLVGKSNHINREEQCPQEIS